MRIIGQIDHPVIKITVFRSDNRLSVKFESGLYEQIYKFRSGEGMETVEDVQRLLDDEFISGVDATLRQMHRMRTAALSRLMTAEGNQSEFEEII